MESLEINENPFDKCMRENLSEYTVNGEYVSGYIDNRSTFELFFNKINSLGYAFSTRRSETNKGENVWFSNCSKNKEVPNINFLGHPFSLEKVTHFQCSQGPRYYKKKNNFDNLDHPSGKKTRVHVLDTKKLGCTAWMVVKCVRIYEDFKTDNNWKTKRKILHQLKETQKDSTANLKSVLQYYVKASIGSVHNHSIISSEMNQQIHMALLQEIKKLVDSGMTSTRDIKICLRKTAEELVPEGSKPSNLNRAFYPTDEVIYAHIYKAIYSTKQNLIDQEALEVEVSKWKAQDLTTNIYFRPYKHNENGNVETLLFCYQANWQKDLMLRYGQLCLLDATYRTTRYALPLFFLCVKTNVGYSVVATFIIQAESTDLIAEALSVIKSWSPNWQPQYWMTDYSEMEIYAIQSIFPQSLVYLCAFHREQAWLRWLRKMGNVEGGTADTILKMWRGIANCTTEEEFEKKVSDMLESDIMKNNTRALQYIKTQWLSEAYRWVNCFGKKDFLFIVNTNNGIESQNNVLKHTYLAHNSDSTLLGVLRIVVNNFFPDMLKKYCINNSIVKSYNNEIPDYLKGRPQKFIKHVMQRITQASNDISKTAIALSSDEIFSVKSSSDTSKTYTIDFSIPQCTCPDFNKFRFPCKHMCAIFKFYPNYNFDRMNAEYINSPYLNIHTEYGHHALLNESSINESNLFIHSNETEEINSDILITFENQKVAQLIRDEAKRLIDMSYICKDNDLMKTTHARLLEMRKEMEKSLPTELGLPLHSSTQSVVASLKRKYGLLSTFKKEEAKEDLIRDSVIDLKKK